MLITVSTTGILNVLDLHHMQWFPDDLLMTDDLLFPHAIITYEQLYGIFIMHT